MTRTEKLLALDAALIALKDEDLTSSGEQDSSDIAFIIQKLTDWVDHEIGILFDDRDMSAFLHEQWKAVKKLADNEDVFGVEYNGN